MSNRFNVIQSHLCVDSPEPFSEKNVFEAIEFLKSECKKNKSKYVEGIKMYELKDDSDAFPQKTQEHKPMTKWEKFAKEKGIKPVKKTKRVWNEDTKAWEFRFGSNTIQNMKLREGIVEGKKSVNQLKREKKERVAKNKKQMLKNKERVTQSKK